MVIHGIRSIGVPPTENVLCDLDIRTHDLENLIKSGRLIMKYLCKFSLKSLQWSRSYRVHNISMAIAG